MSEIIKIKTTPEVWAVIRASHPEMIVFSSYSAPDGDRFGNPSKGVMATDYGFENADYPTLSAETTWDISNDPENKYKRKNEKHEYWLCVGIMEEP